MWSSVLVSTPTICVSVRDPYTDRDTQALESVQKFACKICLKQWDMDYESMSEQLELTFSPGRSTFADHTHSFVGDTRVSLCIHSAYQGKSLAVL